MPDKYGKGNGGPVHKDISSLLYDDNPQYNKPLTTHQARVLQTYYRKDKNVTATAKEIGMDRSNVYAVLKNPKVQWHIANMELELEHHYLGSNDFTVTKTDKMELLWKIAKAGAERGYDKQGNEVMLNPAVSVSAISQLNAMQGHNAPTEVTVTKVDKSEEELKESIARLKAEFEELMAIEGECELVSSGETLEDNSSSSQYPSEGDLFIDDSNRPFDVKIKAVMEKEEKGDR